MLEIKHRLKSPRQIENVFKKGKSTRSGFLFLKYCPNKFRNSRIAFSVGVKFSKKAVDRNRAKRILRSEMKKNLSKLKPGFDIVIFLGQISPKEFEKENIEASLKKALTFSKLIN